MGQLFSFALKLCDNDVDDLRALLQYITEKKNNDKE